MPLDNHFTYLGMEQNQAESRLIKEETDYEVRVTSSPGKKNTEGPYRVIKQHTEGEKLILTVCAIPDPYQE